MIIKLGIKSSGGFTLLEAVVSLALLTMLGMTLGAIIIHSLTGWSSGSSKANAASSASTAIYKLQQDVRIGCSASTPSSTSLNVVVPALITDDNGETYYDPHASTTTYYYYLGGTTLYRKIGAAGAEAVFARNIQSASFSVNGDEVWISVTGVYQSGKSQSQESQSTRVVMRNYQS